MKSFRKVIGCFIAFMAIARNTYADMIIIDEPIPLRSRIDIEEIMAILGVVIIVILIAVYFIAGYFEKNKSDSNDKKNINDLKEESDEQDK